MHIYDYTPPKNNKKATGIVMILFFLAGGLFIFTLLIDIPLPWIIQLISIVAFTAGIFIATRFLAKSFLYSIVQTGDETLDFTVCEITNGGKSQITVCRVALKNIQEAYSVNRTEKESVSREKEIIRAAKRNGIKIFNYCPDINPTKYCIILGEECGEKFLVKITPDDTIVKYLTSFDVK